MINSIRTRITLWYVGVLATLLVAFSVGVYSLLARSLYSKVDENLRANVQVAITSLNHDAEEGQIGVDAARRTVRELYNPPMVIAIFDANGVLLAENSNEHGPPIRLSPSEPVSDVEPVFATISDKSAEIADAHRTATQHVFVPVADFRYTVLVSYPFEPIETELGALRQVLFVTIPIALALVGFGGWFLSRKALEPVVVMSEQARRIGAANLEQRLPVANPRDELGTLATSFNELLSRLSGAFAEQRRFMADASHELRTPLSVVQTTAEVTMAQQHRSEDEYRDAVQVIEEQTSRLARIVEDMFTLARADAGQYPVQKDHFYLEEIVAEVARAGRVLAEARGVTVVAHNLDEAPCFGDEDLVRQMILNLVDNAVRHTPSGGVVRISLTRQTADLYRLIVSDTGSGIPVDAQPRIFERFFRVDKSRSRESVSRGSGAGLGLSIAQWVARLHEGDLQLLHSDRNGSTFVVQLPSGTPSQQTFEA